jgi:hypothetical protein
MSTDNEHVLEICKRVAEETDQDKLTTLIRQLNQELELAERRPPQSSKPGQSSARLSSHS